MKKSYIIILLVLIAIIAVGIYIIKNNVNVWNNKNDVLSDFDIIFNETKGSGKHKIISKNALQKDSYNIYVYDGEVKVIIEGNEYDLKEALLENKITAEDILSKARLDSKNKVASMDAWDDGGTTIYKYKTFNIIKFNKIGGSEDLYIGPTYMNYNVAE